MATASDVKRLAKDETFNYVLSEVRKRQVEVFLYSNSSTEEREKAHQVVRGINEILNYMASVEDDELMKNRNK